MAFDATRELERILYLVNQLLDDYDLQPNLVTMLPHITLLRTWRSQLIVALEAEPGEDDDGDPVP